MTDKDWLFYATQRADTAGERAANWFSAMMGALAVVVFGGYALGYWIGTWVAGWFA